MDHLVEDPVRMELGRKGTSLTSGEDIDMVFTVMDSQYAVGYFPQLKLDHIIPSERFALGYLKRLIFGSHYSTYQLLLLRRVNLRPKPWPISYLGNLGLCLLSGDWHPLTLGLALQIARGKYAAYEAYRTAMDQDLEVAEPKETLAENP